MIEVDKPVNYWKPLGWLIILIGLYAVGIRFFEGLGQATNLNDGFPWGLWIGFDVLVGVGLAAGGFTVAATVHVLNMRHYASISRPSLLTAFLGYLLVCVGLFFDIGHPFRLWHPLIMWNPHSVMFEVAWCVTLYTTVLALEFSPMVFERFHLHVPLRIVRGIYLPLVIAGVLLSTLHQSSLGTVYLIVPDKLHGLWYSPMLPAFFFVSAIAAGLAMTILESFLSARVFGKRLEHDVLVGLARATVVVLAVFFTWRVVDLLSRGNLGLAFVYSQQSVMFWLEIIFGVLMPLVLILRAGDKIKESHLFFYACLVVLGFVLNRLNVSVTGMLNVESYFPKWSEIAVTLALITGGVFLFGMAVKHLNIFSRQEDQDGPPVLSNGPVPWKGLVAVGLLAAIGAAAFIGAPTRASLNPKPAASTAFKIEDPMGALKRLPADMEIPGRKASPGTVMFSHETHLSFQGSPDCSACHPVPFSFNTSGTKFALEGDKWHGEKACGTCHNGDKASDVKESCDTCHRE